MVRTAISDLTQEPTPFTASQKNKTRIVRLAPGRVKNLLNTVGQQWATSHGDPEAHGKGRSRQKMVDKAEIWVALVPWRI